MKSINHQSSKVDKLIKKAIYQAIVAFLNVCVFYDSISVRPERPRRRRLWMQSQSLDARLITSLALKPIFEKKGRRQTIIVIKNWECK